jgi:hypothetical protein
MKLEQVSTSRRQPLSIVSADGVGEAVAERDLG